MCLILGGVAQHVRMDRELGAGFASGSTDDLAHRIGAERAPCARSRILGAVRVSPLQPAQGAQFRHAQGVDRGDALLAPRDVQYPLLQVDLVQAQAH
jgi:hypothetical protein